MTHTVSSALAAALARQNTRPVLFLELGFSSYTTRFCSFQTINWNGSDWLGKNFTIAGLGGDSPPVITIFDNDAGVRTLLLADGIADRPVKIYYGDADTLIGSPSGDPMLAFSGVGGAAAWASGKATIKTLFANAISTLCPRTRMTAETGYNFLAPKGYEFTWGDKVIRLN